MPSVCIRESVALHFISDEEQLKKYLQPHRMELGCFMVIKSGTARLMMNLTEYMLVPQSIVTILPNSIIQITEHSADFSCEIIAFSPSEIRDIDLVRQVISNMETISKSPIVLLSDDEWQFVCELHTTFGHIYNRTQTVQSDNRGLLQNLLMSFFYGVCAIYEKHRKESSEVELSRKEEIVRDYLSLVFKHYDKERRVEWYASQLCMTPTYLNASVKAVRGVSASKIISDAVVLYAKSKLKSSADTVQQIADSLNFPNASFFAKFFKREVGISPTEYREQNL